VGDVGADGDGRVDAEEDHEHGRHQRPSTHPRQADERPDEGAGEDELPAQWRSIPGSSVAPR